MFSASGKKPFQCPKCGFVQLEPAHLISTYCRACGDYYEVGRAPQPVRSPLPVAPALREHRRDVHCHRCGSVHSASHHARSTMCPGCHSAIDLIDFEFHSAASRPVDTRGSIFVGAAGSLTSSWIVCGSARIEGRISGSLISEGDVSLASRHALNCHFSAPSIHVEKAARVALHVPVETDALIVRGRLSAAVRCRGRVHVHRGGVLIGDVNARSVIVERGGVFEGACVIDASQPGAVIRSLNELRKRRAFSPLPPGHAVQSPA
ncbi:MAG: polymer-forming cytoskeletal protein [Terrimicrobiaceae bacterium]|nr:polymer-forming cytoskeletal protein [Terrimicrobiaceae bacterium]